MFSIHLSMMIEFYRAWFIFIPEALRIEFFAESSSDWFDWIFKSPWLPFIPCGTGYFRMKSSKKMFLLNFKTKYLVRHLLNRVSSVDQNILSIDEFRVRSSQKWNDTCDVFYLKKF